MIMIVNADFFSGIQDSQFKMAILWMEIEIVTILALSFKRLTLCD